MDHAGRDEGADLTKRGFLKLTGAGAAAAALFGVPTPARPQQGQGNGLPAELQEILLLIQSGSYIAGFGFAVAAVLKFKAHKTNPTGGGVNWDFVQTWWDALDNVTRTALTALGYTPDALTDGVTALDDGEPGFILAFLEDLETVV